MKNYSASIHLARVNESVLVGPPHLSRPRADVPVLRSTGMKRKLQESEREGNDGGVCGQRASSRSYPRKEWAAGMGFGTGVVTFGA